MKEIKVTLTIPSDDIKALFSEVLNDDSRGAVITAPEDKVIEEAEELVTYEKLRAVCGDAYLRLGDDTSKLMELITKYAPTGELVKVAERDYDSLYQEVLAL